jgi:hypothetical protein
MWCQSGFEASPTGGPDYRNRSVYSYHYYQGVNVGPVGMYLDARLRDARRWGVGAMVRESHSSVSARCEAHDAACRSLLKGYVCHGRWGVGISERPEGAERRAAAPVFIWILYLALYVSPLLPGYTCAAGDGI